eukprot:gene5048-34837_t
MDSWEHAEDGTPPPAPPPPPRTGGLNPNAGTFSFNPSAANFSFQPQQPMKPQQGFNNMQQQPFGQPKAQAPPPPAPKPAGKVTIPFIAPRKAVPMADEPMTAPPPPPAEKGDDDMEVDESAADAPAVDSITAQVAEMNVAPAKVEIIEEVTVDEAAIQKAYNELIAADSRDHLNVVFIGHIDAGKSTLAGQILFLTGGVDKRTIEKYEKEAKDKNREGWYMAYIMDTNEEERTKGITVEVGRAHFETEKKRYTVLDAPGHKNYVPNMIQGACQADVAILVISARKGEYETGFEKGGQTREHAQLAKTLGVSRLIVVVNKLDCPSVCHPDGKWDKDRYDYIVSGLTPFLKSVGYNIKKEVTFLPLAALYGHNVKDPVSPEKCDWYSEGSMFESSGVGLRGRVSYKKCDYYSDGSMFEVDNLSSNYS